MTSVVNNEIGAPVRRKLEVREVLEYYDFEEMEG